jgi:hypothetical protein
VPRHWWISLSSSDCKDRRKQLQRALGTDGDVVRFWAGKKKRRCYALVVGSVDNVPDDMLADPRRLRPVLLIDDDDENDDDLGDVD